MVDEEEWWRRPWMAADKCAMLLREGRRRVVRALPRRQSPLLAVETASNIGGCRSPHDPPVAAAELSKDVVRRIDLEDVHQQTSHGAGVGTFGMSPTLLTGCFSSPQSVRDLATLPALASA